MENTPHNQTQEDNAAAAKAEALEDDDDDEEKEEKPTRRHAPGIHVEKVKEKAEKPRLSITDRLLESIGAKPEKKDDEKDSKEALIETKTEDTKDQETKEEAAPEHHETTDEALIQYEATVAEPIPDETLEAADWDVEPADQSSAERIEPTTSGEVIAETSEEHEEFAELPSPPEAEGETGDEEIGPVEPELIESGLGSEGPPDPPEDEPPTAGGAEEPPEPPSRTTTHYYRSSGGGSGTPWYNAAAADRERARELEDAEYHGRVEGTRRGVLTGLLFGWLIGRHGKKKQARGFEKNLKSKDTQIKSLKAEQDAAAMRLEAVKSTQERMMANMQDKGSKQSVALEKGSQELTRAVTHASESNRQLKSVEKQLGRSVVEVAAVSSAAATAEKNKHTAKNPENYKVGRLSPEEFAVTQEAYEIGKGRHVETSAWHRIEIDEKTGKPVENPEVAYGEEFRRERAKEIFADDSVASSTLNPEEEQRGASRKKKKEREQQGYVGGSSTTQLGGLAAASYVSSDPTDETYATSTSQESGLGASVSTTAHPDHLKHSDLLRFASEPAVWVSAVLVVIILFVFGILR